MIGITVREAKAMRMHMEALEKAARIAARQPQKKPDAPSKAEEAA